MTPSIAFDTTKHVVMILAPITDEATVTIDTAARALTYRRLVEIPGDWSPNSKKGSYFVIVPRTLQPKPAVVKAARKTINEIADNEHQVSVSVSFGGKLYDGNYLVDRTSGSKSHTRLLSTQTVTLPIDGKQLREVADKILLHSDLQMQLSDADHILTREITHEAAAGPKPKGKDQPMLPQAILVGASLSFDTDYNQKVIKLVIMEKSMKAITYSHVGGSCGGDDGDREFAVNRWASATLVDLKLHKKVSCLTEVLIDGVTDPEKLGQLKALATFALSTAATPSKPSVQQWKTAIELELRSMRRDAATQEKLPSGVSFANLPIKAPPPPVTPAAGRRTASSAQTGFDSLADDTGFKGICRVRLSNTMEPIKSFRVESLRNVADTYTLDVQLTQSCGPGEKYKAGWWFRLKKISDGDAPEFFLECVEPGCTDKIKVKFERLLHGGVENEDEYFDEYEFDAV